MFIRCSFTRASTRGSLAAFSLLTCVLQACGGGGGGGGATPTPIGPTINQVIAAWPSGTTWTYRLTSASVSGTRTRAVTASGLVNPNDGQPALELKDTLSLANGTSSIQNDFLFRQDSSGTVYLEGIIPGQGSAPIYVKSSSPGAAVIYPSPMSTGQQIGPTQITLSDGSQFSTLQSSVDGEESVVVPLGAGGSNIAVLSFRITTLDTTSRQLEVTWFSPTLGVVKIQTTDGSVVTTSLLTDTTLPH